MKARIGLPSFFVAVALALGGAVASGCSSDFVSNDCTAHLTCSSPDGGEGGNGHVDSSVGDGGTRDAGAEGGGDDGGEDGQVDTGLHCTAPTSLDCNGTCVDPTSPAHCGTSCTPCPGPEAGGHATCTAGACGIGCASPTSLDCSGSCVDPSQIENCGSCGNVCPVAIAGSGTAVCSPGADGGEACSVTCGGATTETCVTASGTSCFAPTDPNHCGTCGNACPQPASGHGQPTCASPPTCAVSCTAGYHLCGAPADCLSDADEPLNAATDPCILTEAFGVFVKPSGTDSATCGSRASPCQTIGYAMDRAKATSLARVYACGSSGSYTTENLAVGSSRTGLTVYGGLDCSTTPAAWTYNASDKATVAPASGYALQVSAAVTFEDFSFIGASVTATTGASSIAVFASNATGVVLKRCSVQAGAGAGGQSQTRVPQAVPAPNGNPGTASGGGAQVSNPQCPSSIGGAGGPPHSGGANGFDGQPGPPTNPSNQGAASTCQTTGGGGGGGVPGGSGAEGAGASGWAAFTATGWAPLGGQPGTAGQVGQGGGGGGSSGPVSFGGGSGGAGGCGGVGGAAGTGGGSSIAVLLFASTVDLESCTLQTANAGSGGNGAPGQAGQAGGAGATVAGQCGGGIGGGGGAGGGGGGGAGGLSTGLLWLGTAPTINGASTPAAATLPGITVGTAGAAGQNGDGTVGKAGTSGAVVQFQ